MSRKEVWLSCPFCSHVFVLRVLTYGDICPTCEKAKLVLSGTVQALAQDSRIIDAVYKSKKGYEQFLFNLREYADNKSCSGFQACNCIWKYIRKDVKMCFLDAIQHFRAKQLIEFAERLAGKESER